MTLFITVMKFNFKNRRHNHNFSVSQKNTQNHIQRGGKL